MQKPGVTRKQGGVPGFHPVAGKRAFEEIADQIRGQAVADAQRLLRELGANLLGDLLERALACHRAKAQGRSTLP